MKNNILRIIVYVYLCKLSYAKKTENKKQFFEYI